MVFVITLHKAPILEPVRLAGPSGLAMISLQKADSFLLLFLIECGRKKVSVMLDLRDLDKNSFESKIHQPPAFSDSTLSSYTVGWQHIP